MSNQRNKDILTTLGVVLTVAVPGLSQATPAALAKEQTIEQVKQFEANKTAAMGSLLEKLQAGSSAVPETNPEMLTKLAAAASAVLAGAEKSDLGDRAVYLKPIQVH